MKKSLILSFVIALLSCVSAQAQMDAVWEALARQDQTKARNLLEKALKSETNPTDEAMTLILLNTLEGKEDNLSIMREVIDKMNDPSPYLYSMWFNDAVTDGYARKKSDRLKFVKNLLKNDKVNASIKAATGYVLGMHYGYENDMKSAVKYWNQVQSVHNWQFVGPFDNSSGSGFDKFYGPAEQAKAEARFTSKTNSEIHWFTPKYYEQDPWTSTVYHVEASQAVIYAQTFMDLPEAREVIVALGGSGNLKLWINDKLVISEEEERTTELDIYNRRATLPAGTNRIVVQLGYTEKTSYPNFILRFLTPQGQTIEGLTSSPEYRAYNAPKTVQLGEQLPHFAKTYFEQKMKAEPNNPIHAILLSKVFARSGHYNEALEVLLTAREAFPQNVLIEYQLIQLYRGTQDRTQMLQQVEYLRQVDPNLVFFAIYDFQQKIESEDYAEAEKHLNTIGQALGKDSETYLEYLIRLQSARQEYQQMIMTIEAAYVKYPENSTFLQYKYQLEKGQSEEPLRALSILEDYAKENYNYRINQLIINEYTKAGKKKKVEKLLQKQLDMYPNDIDFMNQLASFHYKARDYDKALKYIDMVLGNAPFSDDAWLDRGYIHEALEQPQAAIKDWDMAIFHNPNLFTAREKRRELQNKKPILSYVKNDQSYDLIYAELDNPELSDDNFSYIFNEKNYVVFPEGGSVEFGSLAIKIHNESGIQYWKEASLPYSSSQRLIVDKAEVIKKNRQKINAEQNYNEFVFPSLEVGDAIYIDYRLENYTGGILSKEFWSEYVFNDFVPVKSMKYRIFTPQDYKLYIETANIEQKPTKKTVDDFVCYEWDFSNLPKCNSEDYMPSIFEVGMAVHISTIPSWQVIADWYRDLALPRAKEDYNVNKAYERIFADQQFNSDYDKAKAIYDYLCETIRYSSVSFRQSGHVPQKPMTTLSTQLGDCKDLSTLYHTLARKAGLKTNLVLVNTRDNGEETMKVPTIDFNHCIIRIELDDQILYQELTSEKLPFGAVPNNLANAQALVIPNSSEDKVGEELMHIPFSPMIESKLIRNTSIQLNDSGTGTAQSALTTTGSAAANYRYHFLGLTQELTRDEVQNMLGRYFKNTLKLGEYKFDNLDSRVAEFKLSTDFSLEDEVLSLGGLKAFKPPYFEEIFSLAPFPEQEREHPVLYWNYEPNDYYECTLTIDIPEDAKIIEIPEGLAIDNEFIKYELVAEQISERQVKLTRRATINKANISADKYETFRETIKKIVKAEESYIAYK